jgi:hypothetical protein
MKMKAGSITIEWDSNGKATYKAPMGSGDDRALSVQMLAQCIIKLTSSNPGVLLPPPPLEKRG